MILDLMMMSLFYVVIISMLVLIGSALFGNKPLTEEDVWAQYDAGRLDRMEAIRMIKEIQQQREVKQ